MRPGHYPVGRKLSADNLPDDIVSSHKSFNGQLTSRGRLISRTEHQIVVIYRKWKGQQG